MRHNVKYSTLSRTLTVLVFVLTGSILLTLNAKATPADKDCITITITSALMACLLLAALYYAPLSLTVSDTALCLRTPLRVKTIPFAEIESIRMCPPTMGEKRIFGSGGFFGYWGWFSEKDTGRYFAYYGKSSDCFLVTLKNGRKYMLGCEGAPEVVGHVSAHIINRQAS